MTVIWKFPFPMQNEFTIEMPRGAQFLFVASQHGTGCLWAMVAPKMSREQRRFRLYGTGHEIQIASMYGYIGSFMSEGGNFVWHLFEVKAIS
jgi:hypothetical protein